MGILNGYTRRKFLRSAAIGAGAMAGSKGLFAGRGAQAQDMSFLTPPGGKFNNIELTYFQDSNWLHAPLWLSPHFPRAMPASRSPGVRCMTAATRSPACCRSFCRASRAFDWVQFPSRCSSVRSPRPASWNLWTSISHATTTPNEYLDWVMPAYGEFYTKWNGQRYGVMLDGDIHILHYRRNYFEDPELQSRFSQPLPA